MPSFDKASTDIPIKTGTSNKAKSAKDKTENIHQDGFPARLRGDVKKVEPGKKAIHSNVNDGKVKKVKPNVIDDGVSRLRSPEQDSKKAFSAKVGERQKETEGKEKRESEAHNFEHKYEIPSKKDPGKKSASEANLIKSISAENKISITSEIHPKVARRLDMLRKEGHGPQRHLDLTDEQLRARLGTPVVDAGGSPIVNVTGKVKAKDHVDPVTGTVVDGDHGGTHFCGPIASAFTRPGDYTSAEFYFRSRARVENSPAIEAKIDDVLGEGASARMRGYRHDKIHAGQYEEIDFTGGSLLASFKRNTNGEIVHKTMFAVPLDEVEGKKDG